MNVTLHVANELKGVSLSEDGAETICVSGATAGIATLEYEPGLGQDMHTFFETVIPQEKICHGNMATHSCFNCL